MTKLDAGLMTSLPASDPGSTAVWGSKRINPRPQSCLCLTWSGYPSNDDDDVNKKTPSPFATLQLPPIFPLYLTAISLPGLTARYLAGWDRVVQGYTSSVQSVSLLPRFPSRLVSGLPVIVLKPSLSYMLLSGVSLTPRHVISTLSPSFPTLYLSFQLSLPPYHI